MCSTLLADLILLTIYFIFHLIIDLVIAEEDDIHDIMTELVEVEDRWKLIGVALRLKPSKIKAIEEENHGKLANCLMDALSNWLNKSYNTAKFGNPSWRKVVEAVASPAGGDNAVLAKSIAMKHQSKLTKLLFSMLVLTGNIH